MASFLDVVLPPLLLAFFGFALLAVAVWLAVARARLWAAKRRRITIVPASLAAAADVLAAVISDPSASQNLRDRAIGAYGQITALTEKEPIS